MSDRPKRSNPELYSLDYGTFHRTGEKVYKLREESDMDPKTLKIKERQIVDDINEFFLLSSLDELDSAEDIQEGLDNIAALSKEFRHLHIQLQEELGKVTYDAEFTEFNSLLAEIRKYQKDGKAKLKSIPKGQNDLLASTRIQLDAEKEKDRLDNEMRVRKSILVEEEVFREKMKMEVVDFDSTSISSIERLCIRFEQLLDDYFQLLSKAKIAFSDDYERECKDIFEKTLSEIRDQIKKGKDRISVLTSSEKDRLAKEQEMRDQAAAETLKKEQMTIALVLSKEIDARSSDLVKKCDLDKMSYLDDFKILECSKNIPTLDAEFREIFSKFTEFSKITSLYTDDGDNLVVRTCKAKEDALSCRNSYAQKLHEIITERDISEEKLKRSSSLPLELPKFKGFDSKLDIYTSKSNLRGWSNLAYKAFTGWIL